MRDMATKVELKQLAQLGLAERRKIAAEAEVDERTLARFIAGQNVRTMARDRIDRALDRLGYGKGDNKDGRVR